LSANGGRRSLSVTINCGTEFRCIGETIDREAIQATASAPCAPQRQFALQHVASFAVTSIRGTDTIDKLSARIASPARLS
jgi:hypothetical protein